MGLESENKRDFERQNTIGKAMNSVQPWKKLT